MARRWMSNWVSKVLRRRRGCSAFSGEIALVVGDQGQPSERLESHLKRCLACQAELARYRRMVRMVRELRHEVELLPAGVRTDIVSRLSLAAERRAVRDTNTRRSRIHVVGLGLAVLLITILVGLIRGKDRSNGGNGKRP
jgi:anti-sigma factor RsiW